MMVSQHMRGCAVAIALCVFTACSQSPAKSESAPEPARQAPTQAEPTDSRPMLLVFSRDYCTPCQVMKPWLEELSQSLATVDVVTVNVDRQRHEKVSSFFHVSAVPSLIYVEADGTIAKRTEGLARKPDIVRTIRRLGWAEQ